MPFARHEARPARKGPGDGRRRVILTDRRLALAVLFAIVTPATGSAEGVRPATASLEWQRGDGAEGCLEAPALEHAVELLLERTVFVSPGESDVTVAGVVEKLRGEEGFVARLVLRTRDGREMGVRELRTPEPSCAGLDGPLPLVLAMMVEERESAALHLPERAPPAAPSAPPAPAAPDTSSPPPAPPPPPPLPSPWGLRAGGGAALALGLLPGPAVGPRLDILVEPPRLPPLGLTMSFWPALHYETPSGGGLFSAWHAGAVSCPRLAGEGAFRLSACAGLDAGQVSGVGLDLPVTHEQIRPYLQAELRAVLRVRIVGPLWADLAAGAAVPFVRTNFFSTTADGAQRTIFESWPVVPVGSVGLDVGLPE